MRYLKALGVCLLAAFALCALLVATASAEDPAIWQCGAAVKNAATKKYEGRYEKGCKAENAKHEGKYELEEWRVGSKETGGKKGKVKAFKGKSAKNSRIFLEDLTISTTVTCTSFADTGFITGPKSTGDVHVRFKGCDVTGGFSCNSKGLAAGEIEPEPLKGTLGYINKAAHEVGVDLTTEVGKYIATFACNKGEEKLRVSGSVIGKVKVPLEKFTKEMELSFLESAANQEITKLEGQPTDVLGTELLTGGEKEFGPEPCDQFQWEHDEIGGCYTGSGQEALAVNKGEELELRA